MDILIIEDDNTGFAQAKLNNYQIGTMNYSKMGKDLIAIDATFVEPAHEGKGVGKKMLYKIVEMARKNNIKIIPICPFAVAMFNKMDSIADVLKS
ncbi:N-acetyltransferase [Pedobacter psychrodurus]|uniref:N-acetyltransferase n=1 Tax=Pedobacter psychrodurus TaxID=2530456 RepID=A0A4R0PZQ0_9SPHI|nr:N-acetyltransferase [Pedobacter psychrodurus]